jgi:predicted alpha/beta hydrolase family esterase
MVKSLILQLFIVLSACTSLADDVQLELSCVSQLPVHAYEQDGAKANILAIIGGKGIKNREGKSKDFLVIQKSIFTSSKLNYYLFSNWSKSKKATRVSQERVDRISRLVDATQKHNSRPTYLVGFSRGSVDAAAFSKIYPKRIKGIVLASGIYESSSRKAKFYSMERLISSKIGVAVIVAHHENDVCHITLFAHAKEFY